MPRYRMREDYPSQYLALSLEMQPVRERAKKLSRQLEEQRQRSRYYEKQQEAYERQQRAEAKARQMRALPKLRKLEEKRQVFRYYEKTAPPEWKESVEFYTELGYPLYAGKYAPFKVPEGYKVEKITKTEEGLQVAFISTAPEPQKGIAETILSWDFPSYKGPSLMEILGVKKKELPMTATSREMGRISGVTVHPLAPIAAPIASFESPVYSLGRLVGLPTPRPPPTFIGGVIGKGLEAGLGWESTELEETMAYGPQYAVGTIFGDIFVSYLLGKGVEKVVVKPIQTRASTWLSRQYLEKGPLAWKGVPEKAVMRITGAKPYFPSGVVSYPAVGKVGLKGLKAQQLAWELSLTPRTSLVTVTKVGAKRSVFTFTRGVGYTPMAVTLAKAMSVKEMGGRQALLVIEKPVIGKLPYIPKAIGITGKKGISQLVLGFGVTTLLKVRPPTQITRLSLERLQPTLERLHPKKRQILFPKVWFPTLAYTREKFRPLTIETPRRKERERVIPILRIQTPPIQISTTKLEALVFPIARAKERLVPALIPIQTQIVKQLTIQETMLKQLQIQKVMMAPPILKQITVRKPPRFWLPRGGRDVSRGRRGLWGRWFKREHRIKTPEEMARIFFGKPKPRRKKGKRVKKKRGKTKKRKGYRAR